MKYHWEDVTGRDREGEKIFGTNLVDETGRILGYIDFPQADESSYEVSVGNSESASEDRRYTNLESAKHYAEQRVHDFLLAEAKRQEINANWARDVGIKLRLLRILFKGIDWRYQ